MNINIKRFTDDEYLSKKEIENKIGSSEIETIWRSVTDFREKYRQVVNLRQNESNLFSICLSPAILTYCTMSERKLARFAMNFTELSVKQDLSSDKQLELFSKNTLKQDLFEIGKYYSIRVNEEDIDLVMGTSFDSSNPISNFYKGYKYLIEGNRPFNLETILELYKVLRGNEEVHFRKNENVDGTTSYRIPDFMATLIDYVNNHGEYSCFVTAPIVYGYIKYVKPFERYNTLVALLLSMKILKDSGYNNTGFFVSLSKEILNEEKKMSKALENTKFYGDFTYIMIAYCQCFIDAIEDKAEELAQIDIIPNITGEVRIVEKIVEVPVEKIVEVPVQKEEKVEEAVEYGFKEYVKPEPKPVTFNYENIDPIAFGDEEESEEEIKEEPVAEPAFAPTPVVAPTHTAVLPEQKAEKIYIDAMDMREVAEKLLEDEFDVDKIGESLLESNPMMKYHQAHFFASHHEIGRFYTISQFKEYADCAYETARTSMDYLAACKLYKKEQIKNKFVYRAVEF